VEVAKRGQDEWLIPPRLSPDGKDSLGRGLDGGSIAAVVAADAAVQSEREARWDYLRGAYRDPYAARAAIDELVKRQGWTSAAARVAAAPVQFGELRGKEGFFAGSKARAERAVAQRAAEAIVPSLMRIGKAEAWAECSYRSEVVEQRAADATGIPRLSPPATAAIGTLAAAPDEAARAKAWWALQADIPVAGELQAFGVAVTQRFGAEAVRAMLRSAGRAGAVMAPSVASVQQPALDQVSGLTVTLTLGERAGEAAAERQMQRQRQVQHRGWHMGR
jgi:hypothetical protein